MTANNLLKLLRAQTTFQAPLKGKKKENTRADDMEADDAEDIAQSTSSAATSAGLASQCATIINNLADLFQQFGTRDQPDIARTTIESLAQVTRLCMAGTSHVQRYMQLMLDSCCAEPDSERPTVICPLLHLLQVSMLVVPLKGHNTQSNLLTADSIPQACFKALMAVLHTRHGSVRELSAVVLRQMTANILGLADSTGAAAAPSAAHPKHMAAVRLQALQFVQDVARCHASLTIADIQCMFQHS